MASERKIGTVTNVDIDSKITTVELKTVITGPKGTPAISKVQIEIYDEWGNASVGDLVVIKSISIPIKGKNWKLIEFLLKAEDKTNIQLR